MHRSELIRLVREVLIEDIHGVRDARHQEERCLDDKVLHDFCKGALSKKAFDSTIEHLADCPDCRTDLRFYWNLKNSTGQASKATKHVVSYQERIKKATKYPTFRVFLV